MDGEAGQTALFRAGPGCVRKKTIVLTVAAALLMALLVAMPFSRTAVAATTAAQVVPVSVSSSTSTYGTVDGPTHPSRTATSDRVTPTTVRPTCPRAVG